MFQYVNGKKNIEGLEDTYLYILLIIFYFYYILYFIIFYYIIFMS